jgi:hypothetical protein
VVQNAKRHAPGPGWICARTQTGLSCRIELLLETSARLSTSIRSREPFTTDSEPARMSEEFYSERDSHTVLNPSVNRSTIGKD